MGRFSTTDFGIIFSFEASVALWFVTLSRESLMDWIHDDSQLFAILERLARLGHVDLQRLSAQSVLVQQLLGIMRDAFVPLL